ncbi:hypothetical protein WKR88_16340 [Trinickia caryophylli]|uniref:Uncharacterized protein n=1 Tax=Trinickia caryophylli TaxID=28094 RepID=A0A1X7FQ69_TRICW|nr:hypothetical protein [Trinickia caryophylli]PMS09499.1 hypothetical protein C0Z17_24375 [Trinickia caryophylli]TRX14463.1 hypothetical protein FNF07_24645 [Trinickia caryophylli]WQE14300.1 hypothetical protein U0034_26835 [Trinickia caryophylli]SMF56604.1 hypothetical protein SAMN06295900_110167 [Trinickia caryophylli]GLU33186.1 hypothetical protein Busp01_30280 [Trinickia caryophylli]
MKKLLIATVIGALSATTLLATANAAEQATPSSTAKKKPKAPAPKHRLIKRKPGAAAAKADPVPEGAIEWSCTEGHHFMLQGDMKRDQIVTVHWGEKNYKLPREATTTGADRFHDAATGMDLVVIPTKAMLFSDKDSSRLADECKTAAMMQGSPAPTQSNALQKAE